MLMMESQDSQDPCEDSDGSVHVINADYIPDTANDSFGERTKFSFS